MTTDRFDVVVVGGGVAGCVVASRLSEAADRSVLLLEAGPDLRPARASTELTGMNHLRTQQLEDRWVRIGTDGPVPYLGGRGIGGSSAVNGMVMMWGSAADYDRWFEHYGAVGWNVSARQRAMSRVQETIAPVLTGRSRWGSVSRSLAAGAKAAGLRAVGDHNTGEPGVGSVHLGTRDGRRHLFVEAYLEPARTRSNLVVGVDATVRRVVLDANRAVGVELVDGAFVEAGDVVLAAGALADPLLLQASGIASPGIGANLHDHPVVAIPIALSESARASEPDAMVMGCVVRASVLEPLDTLLFPLDHLGQSVGEREHGAVMLVLLSSRSRGRVEPDGSITRNLFSDPFDRELLVRAAAFTSDVLGTMEDIGEPERHLLDRADDELIDWARKHPANIFHAGGTCRMGAAGDEQAVTDGRGAVLGHTGLWIADASLIPEPVHAPPMSTVAMLAEHVADVLGEHARN
jgi:choline dehydrogenase/5-(hydroxymethyl)furfural/furfural oxidase